MIVKNCLCGLLCIVAFTYTMDLVTAQQRSDYDKPVVGASSQNDSGGYVKNHDHLRTPKRPLSNLKRAVALTGNSVKVGVVLSGGGAKGFAHIGALKVIEEAGIPIDYITGTSMGAVIGGLYASGYNATQLDSLARNINWQKLISEQSQRRQLTTFEKKLDEKFLINLPITEKGIDLPRGLISGQNVYELLTQLTKNVHLVQEFDKLPIPFRAVATNLETAEATVFDSGYLPDAIRASISIPSIFIPYEVNGSIYVDGGLMRNLPVTDVLEMGADIVISVDVGEPLKKFEELNSMIEVLNQAVLLHASRENQIQQTLSNIHIAPPLDTLKSYSISDFGRAVELVNFGEWMARPFMDQLDSLAARTKIEKKTGQRHAYEPEDNKYQLKNIEVNGLKNLTRNFIVTELNLDISKPLTLKEINTAVNKLHGTGFFETIRYNIERTSAGHQLILQIKETNANKVRAGFRFDTEREAALIFNTTFRNIFNTPSLSQANLRLGERIFANIQYASTPGNRPRFGIRADVNYLKDNITWFDEETRVSSFTSHNYRLDLFAGLLLNNTIELGFGARQEFFNLGNEINTAALPFSDDNFFSIYGRFWLDTYNRLHFPTSGQSFLIEYNLAESALPASADFTRQLFYGDWIFPASNKVAFNLTTFAGRSTGSELPEPYWFNFMEIDRLLRTDRFVGYEDDEDAAKNMFMLGAGMQYEFSFNKFLILSGNIGNRFNVWRASRFTETNLSGVGVGLGINTFLGPIKLTTSYSERNDLFVRLDIGYRF